MTGSLCISFLIFLASLPILGLCPSSEIKFPAWPIFQWLPMPCWKLDTRSQENIFKLMKLSWPEFQDKWTKWPVVPFLDLIVYGSITTWKSRNKYNNHTWNLYSRPVLNASLLTSHPWPTQWIDKPGVIISILEIHFGNYMIYFSRTAGQRPTSSDSNF